jgi:hypothetical protein
VRITVVRKVSREYESIGSSPQIFQVGDGFVQASAGIHDPERQAIVAAHVKI